MGNLRGDLLTGIQHDVDARLHLVHFQVDAVRPRKVTTVLWVGVHLAIDDTVNQIWRSKAMVNHE